MKFILQTLPATLVSLCSMTLADTISVCPDGTCDHQDIQAAVDAAGEGDEIQVAAGVYTSSHPSQVVDIKGKRLTLRSISGPGRTIIDGEGQRRGIACIRGETAQTLVSGFTIVNCRASPTDYNFNGAIDYWENDGAGMIIFGSSPTIVSCEFKDNIAQGDNAGGGLFMLFSDSLLEGCRFTANQAASWGAGVLIDISSPTFEECVFEDNIAGLGGGGLGIADSDPTLSGCIIRNNQGDLGTGLLIVETGTTSLFDCIICGNAPESIHGSWHDGGGNEIGEQCVPSCPADLDGDNHVDGTDLGVLLAFWGDSGLFPAADLNDDQRVDGQDLTMLLGLWGTCP